MKERLRRIARALAFPAFYLLCLGLFGYLTFPYNRLKDRLVAEIEKRGKPGQHLEIGKLTSYWFTGVELRDVKLHLPPEESSSSAFPGAGEFGMPAATPGKESVITIDEAHARVRILPLLIGRVRLDFTVVAYGGTISGTAPLGTKGDVEVEIDHVDLSSVDMIANTVGLPIKGIASGKLSLNAPDGKFNKANGSLDLTVAGVVVSKEGAKFQGMLEVPPAKLGDLTLSAEAKDGALKITKLNANGHDLELVGDGKINLKEPWQEANADLYVRFKFTDAYRGKNATTKTLLGEPGSSTPGLIEGPMMPKMKRGKRADGFYGFHVYGPLKRLRFDPSTVDSGSGTTSSASPPRRPGRNTDSPFIAPPRRPGLLPGAAAATGRSEEVNPENRREDPPSPPPSREERRAEPEPPSRAAAPPPTNTVPAPEPTPAAPPVNTAPAPEQPEQQPAP